MATASSHPQNYPPSVHHRSKFLSASEAAPILSTFLEATRKFPHLHPDALLLSEGVKHGPKSGPNGGIAIHHLRRIEAGMRGESLEEESKEELRAQFGEEAVPLELRNNLPGAGAGADAGAGDDTRLDELIEEGEERRKKDNGPPAGETEQQKRKREKKERKEREKASKRKLGDAEEDVAPANEDQAPAANEEKPRKKAKKSHEPEAPIAKEPSPAAASSATPKKKSKKDKTKVKKEESLEVDGLPVKKEDVQSQRDYELSQRPLEGEVGEREGAPNVRQNGPPPVVVKHDSEGNVQVPSNPKSEAEKAERKAAKKARRAAVQNAKGG